MSEIKLFVDDDRELPAATWTLAVNHREALRYFRPKSRTVVREMSLDWHLGRGSLNGLDLAREMVGQDYYFDIGAFRTTERIIFHSSDVVMARQQLDIFQRAQDDGQINPDCQLIINHDCRRPIYS